MGRKNSKALLELGLSEDFLRIIEHSYDGILITLKDSTIVFVNSSYSRILGVAPEKLLDRKLSQVEPDSMTLKVLENGQELINVSEYVSTLNEWIFGSVLLLPCPEYPVASISIITKLDRKLTDRHRYDDAPRTYIESYMDEILSLEKPLPPTFSKTIGKDRKFRQVLFNAYKASNADFPVLVFGESGTGKELIVRAIHETSHRRDHKFVALNCAAITSTLVESELFGYEPGSFTNANRDGKKGLFDLAHKGTLFFDEAGDFELSTQAKILRVLEEKAFRRIGGAKDIHVDTRIISATNKDLNKMILDGRFREDLFYRINTMSIHIPPLRERGNDMELLANYFLLEFSRSYQKEIELADESIEILYSYHWPGNVRELRNVLDYSINMADTKLITPRDLPPYILLSRAKSSLKRDIVGPLIEKSGTYQKQSVYKDVMNSFERDLIEIALKKARNRSEAMKLLGLSRRAFYLKLNKHGF